MTLSGAEHRRSICFCLWVGVAGGNGPQRWVPEDGRAGRSGEETSSPLVGYLKSINQALCCCSASGRDCC